jgi:hypothetical protein
VVEIDSSKARRDHLVEEWLTAKEGADKHKRIADEAAEALIKELGIGGRHELLPGVGVKVQGPSMRFEDDLAREVLTPEQYASICEPKASSTLAAKMLPGVLVDQCKKPGTKPSVRPL